VDSSRALDWATLEWVSVDTPYGERLPIRMHLPLDARPPYQAVVFFPGGNVLRSLDIGPPMLDFVVRSGRVLIEPVYEGTFHRNDGRTFQRFSAPSSQAAMVVHWAQDLGRVLDYLEERPDFDATRVAYLGLSFGAGVSSGLLPYERRFRAAVLFSGGFGKRESQASIDRRAAVLRRVQLPLLMLGGRHDFANPTTHQEAFFRAFGAPAEDKRLVVIENAGHWPLPMNEVIRETADWLDRYLGPVAPHR
jgi:pimeloyl-ACP methyl ester carboxylesterase